MKRLLVCTALILGLSAPSTMFAQHRHSSSSATCCSKSASDTHVHGYTRRNGTVVKPYTRSHADSTQMNNFSTKGNINPYTSKRGTKATTH